jgi:hypothetical protein
MNSQFLSKGLKAATLLLALCLGAVAIHAWQTRGNAVETETRGLTLSSVGDTSIVGHRETLPPLW